MKRKTTESTTAEESVSDRWMDDALGGIIHGVANVEDDDDDDDDDGMMMMMMDDHEIDDGEFHDDNDGDDDDDDHVDLHSLDGYFSNPTTPATGESRPGESPKTVTSGSSRTTITTTAMTTTTTIPNPPSAATTLVTALTGRPPQMLYLSCDARGTTLTEYQQLLRKQIEVFEAGPLEVQVSAQGRNKPIVLGQVGIRCRHCAYAPPEARTKGAVYFPSKLEGVYQMAQNMANIHICGGTCPFIAPDLRDKLIQLRSSSLSASGTGKSTWAQKVAALGVFEDQYGLRFTPTIKG